MNQNRFQEIYSQFRNKHVLVVGDMMLDVYLWGNATRISPEAPVPVVEIESISNRLGGAANVALNVQSLGANVSLMGLVGDDQNASVLRTELKKYEINTDCVLQDKSRPTSVKTRVIAHQQQVVRTDWESKNPLSQELLNQFQKLSNQLLSTVDGIIITDYNKGLITPEFISFLLSEANLNSIPVFVDPKTKYFHQFKHIRLFKPNANEFQTALGMDVNPENAKLFRTEINSDLLLITLGSKGMLLVDESGVHTISTQARTVHDVSGAGDTVIAVFALSDLCGATPLESSILSNLAAGRVCEEVGVVPITSSLFIEIFNHYHE